MKRISKANIVILAFLAISWAPANADSLRIAGDPETLEMKVEYRGDDTPDGIIFQSLIRRIATGYQSSPDRTLTKIKRNMAIESDVEALEFIGLFEMEHRKLVKAKTHAKHAYICVAQPGRSKSELFGDLDTLTAVEIDLAAAAYDDFSASLGPEKSSNLDSWIQKTKAGFQYYVPSAEQVTAKMGVDAVTHYKDQCKKIEQRLEGMK